MFAILRENNFIQLFNYDNTTFDTIWSKVWRQLFRYVELGMFNNQSQYFNNNFKNQKSQPSGNAQRKKFTVI